MRLLRALFVISLAAAASGCADQSGLQIIVLNHAVPDEGCILTPTDDGAFMAQGIVDANGAMSGSAATGYLATPLIKNIADSADGTLESERTVILQGARVDLVIGTHSDGTPLLSDAQLGELTEHNALKFTVPFSGSVSPDGGPAVLGFDAIPREVLTAVGEALDVEADERGLIQVVYTIFGETVAGSSVETDPFSFPVNVCVGCLVVNIGDCTAIPDGDYTLGGQCNLYQDAPTQCCAASPTQSVCPAVPADT
jgi:hypothetical protein